MTLNRNDGTPLYDLILSQIYNARCRHNIFTLLCGSPERAPLFETMMDKIIDAYI